MSRIPLPRWAVLTGRNAELLAYLRSVDEAIRRRVHLVPFPHPPASSPKLPTIKEK
jgi:hypothetical protein